jgi:hypothetical protein
MQLPVRPLLTPPICSTSHGCFDPDVGPSEQSTGSSPDRVSRDGGPSPIRESIDIADETGQICLGHVLQSRTTHGQDRWKGLISIFEKKTDSPIIIQQKKIGIYGTKVEKKNCAMSG